MSCVLVCDDEKDIAAALKIYLESDGYQVICAYNGLEALNVLKNNTIHLVLMDIMMPGMDGISALVKLREESNIPVIMLTAKGEDTDKVLGLNIGADDYITKPFNPVEMLARVRSQLRRYTQFGSAKIGGSSLHVGEITLDDEAKEVRLQNEAVNLTPTEYEILKLMMKSPGKVFSSKDIFEKVWGSDFYRAESTIAVHIRHLREKLEINPAEPTYLKVVWGQGYKIDRGRSR